MYWGRFGFSIGQICFTTLIIAIVRQPKSWQARWLSTRWLGAVGVRSYCLYLVHVPIAVLAEDILHPVIGAWWILPVVVLLPITTELLHRYVEQPGIRARRRLLPNIP